MNSKQLKIWYEIRDNHERMIWIGCNPEDPEMYKKQCDDGFGLMMANLILYNELHEAAYDDG